MCVLMFNIEDTHVVIHAKSEIRLIFWKISLQIFQLNNAVSGALDRLHYEKDPCVRYDAPRKVWIYLHRGRTEEDFGTYKIP